MARKLHVARVWQIEYKYPGMYGGDGGCPKSRIAPFAIVYFGKKNYLTVAKKQTL